MKAHQRLIRERRRAEDSDADMFGRWWESIDTDIKKATVREIDYKTAENVILDYEWLGTMPAIVRFCYGIYFGDVCGGVVVYGDEYSENLGKWDSYGYTGKMLLLARGACVHWAHPHSASKLIRRSIDLLPARYEIITATADPDAGEIGTIYQACGFVAAQMSPNTKLGATVNGKRLNNRSIRALIGSGSAERIRALGLVPHLETQKVRYFAFRGSAGTRKRHLRAIKHRLIPYPKRDKYQERDGDNQSQGGGQCAGHAPISTSDKSSDG